MTIKKFSVRGLDTTANIQVVTSDNLNNSIVRNSFTTAFPILGGLRVSSIFSGNGAVKNTVNNVTAIEFDDDAGFVVTNRGSGNVLVAMESTFKFWEVTGSQQLVASGLDHITINSGNNIVITSDATRNPYQSIRFSVVDNPNFAGNLVVGKNLTIAGNLIVNGTTTTVNSSTLDVADRNITIARGAQNSLQADGAGITIDGAMASLIYQHSTGSFVLNKTTRVTANVFADGYFYSNGMPFVSGGGASITVSNTAPAGSETGSMWFNSTSGELFIYYSDTDGAQWVQPVGGIGPQGVAGPQGPVGPQGPAFAISVGETPPASPSSGTLWWDSSVGSLFFYYIDSDSSQWVSAAVAASGGGGGGGGGVSLGTRSNVNASTSSLANGATGNLDITGYKGYVLYKIATSAAAWVRIYTDAAARTADAARSESVDPGTNSGVVAEVITTGANTIVVAPATIGFNNESTPTSTIPLAVTNKSGSAASITVTLTILQIEV